MKISGISNEKAGQKKFAKEYLIMLQYMCSCVFHVMFKLFNTSISESAVSNILQVDMVHVAFVCDTSYVANSELRVTFFTCNARHIKHLELLKISPESSIMNVNNCTNINVINVCI